MEMTDWSLLDGNPTPGNPDLIDQEVSRLRNVSDSMLSASDEFSRIAQGTSDANWQGKAADTLRGIMNDFCSDLKPISQSFSSLASAMDTYQRELRDLQARAARALSRAKIANRAIATSQRQLDDAEAILRAQSQQLRSAESSELRHNMSSVAEDLIDPSGMAARAQQSRRLASQSASARNRVADARNDVQRVANALTGHRDELDSARDSARGIRDEFDVLSNNTASAVDASLVDSLKNLSNLEKLRRWVADEVVSIAESIKDGTILEKIRGLIEKLEKIAGWVLLAITIALVVVAVFASGGALAALLVPAFVVMTKIVAVLAVAKLATTAAIIVRAKAGGTETDLTFGDLAVDAVSAALAVGGASKASAAAKEILKAGSKAGGTAFVKNMIAQKPYTRMTQAGVALQESVKVVAKNVWEGTRDNVRDELIESLVDSEDIRKLPEELINRKEPTVVRHFMNDGLEQIIPNGIKVELDYVVDDQELFTIDYAPQKGVEFTGPLPRLVDSIAN